LFNYVKLEAEYRYLHKYAKTELATRFFIGAALPRLGQAIPVFKQYFMGGPNSMRAWGLRQLGLGSSKLIDTTTAGISDRFGDLSIEANLEYRFTLANIAGIKLGSALYTDIGNLWNISTTSVDGTRFKFSNLAQDIAIGFGTGLRLDFNYFLLRFDFAYRVKDPARPGNGGWMSIKNFEWTNTRENNVQIPNYAFQFGIGLPF
jgi:outer membrane protein insertion porin family